MSRTALRQPPTASAACSVNGLPQTATEQNTCCLVTRGPARQTLSGARDVPRRPRQTGRTAPALSKVRYQPQPRLPCSVESLSRLRMHTRAADQTLRLEWWLGQRVQATFQPEPRDRARSAL